MKGNRSIAIPHDGTGDNRYRMLKEGTLQAAKAYSAGFYLEAIVLTEGMLWCRIASRYEWVVKKAAIAKQSSRQLLQEMANVDREELAPHFAAFTTRINEWFDGHRNPLAHGAAKLLDKDGPSFSANMTHARKAAELGFRILVDWDTLDMKSRLANGWEVDNWDSKVRGPASYPDAFDALRQLVQQPSTRNVLDDLRKQRA
ncbi:MAG: hypothetical protein JNL12_10765 [Planctomycetes bacterium]|nr:hypothetical protein [Planctomycetota bacterium]